MKRTQERIDGNDSVGRDDSPSGAPHTERSNDQPGRMPPYRVDDNPLHPRRPNPPRRNLEPLRVRKPILEHIGTAPKHGRLLTGKRRPGPARHLNTTR